MNNFMWNQIALAAILKISKIKQKKNYNVDNIFNICENELKKIGATENDIYLRLYALAQYCYRAKITNFCNSSAYSKFSQLLAFKYFERVLYELLSKNDIAIIIFWIVFRCTFKNLLPEKHYECLEIKLNRKSYELGTSRMKLKEENRAKIIF